MLCETPEGGLFKLGALVMIMMMVMMIQGGVGNRGKPSMSMHVVRARQLHPQTPH